MKAFYWVALFLGAAPSFATEAQKYCPLSETQKNKIRAVMGKATQAPYTNHGVPGLVREDWMEDALDIRTNFSPATTISQLTDKNGDLFLFRIINARYIKGFKDDGKGWIQHEGNAYSYSLAPAIVGSWGSSKKDYSYTLISLQNLNNDSLRYPKRGLKPSTVTRPLLQPTTKIGDIIYYEEVKVPVDKENVLFIIKSKEFRKIHETFGREPYRIQELLDKLIASPAAESPVCPKNAGSVKVIPEPAEPEVTIDVPAQ
jgi:hypothetical protein